MVLSQLIPHSVCFGFSLGYSAIESRSLKLLKTQYSCVDNMTTLKQGNRNGFSDVFSFDVFSYVSFMKS